MQHSKGKLIPGMMQIMQAVALESGISQSTIMSGYRGQEAIEARTAFYKTATGYGYSKDEIMWYLDRNRTVGYNYDSRLEGHLKNDRRFLALCGRVSSRLGQLPHRAPKVEQRPIVGLSEASETTGTEAEMHAEDEEPVFKAHKSPFGWFFTAEDMRLSWQACREARKYFETFGRGREQPKRRKILIEAAPVEMNTADALDYLDVGLSYMTGMIKKGYITPHQKTDARGNWYYDKDLREFAVGAAYRLAEGIYLKTMKQTKPKPVPLEAGDRVILTQGNREATVEVLADPAEPSQLVYAINGENFPTFHDALMRLLTQGFSGATIKTERLINQPCN